MGRCCAHRSRTFGGKRRAADLVWSVLGPVDHYVEPFCGSAAVLLARPDEPRCETVNDLDGMVANFWRALRSDPAAVAGWCDWPVTEVDLHARHLWLLGQRESLTERLIADPDWYDAKVAGWWCWGACAWIGTGWCSEPSRKMPHTGNEGRGIHAPRRRGAAFADDAVAFGSVAEWFAALSQRLRGVRVCSGDWSRVLGSSSLWAHVRSSSTGVVGVYLDPPYSEGEQQYAAGGTGTGLSAEVRAWALKHGANPRLRIVLSGYAGEHDELEGEGWRVVEWKANGGFSNASGENVNRHRERLWCSPACVGARQLSLLDLGGAR